ENFQWFNYGLGHYYFFGTHKPGFTDINRKFQRAKVGMPIPPGGSIGTPDEVRSTIRAFHDAGIDQIILLHQAGHVQHEHICESLELFAKEVMPEFADGEEDREAKKMRELEPYIEQAMKRKETLREVAE